MKPNVILNVQCPPLNSTHARKPLQKLWISFATGPCGRSSQIFCSAVLSTSVFVPASESNVVPFFIQVCSIMASAPYLLA